MEWRRDGFGVLNCLRAKVQQHTARTWRSDIIRETFGADDQRPLPPNSSQIQNGEIMSTRALVFLSLVPCFLLSLGEALRAQQQVPLGIARRQAAARKKGLT